MRILHYAKLPGALVLAWLAWTVVVPAGKVCVDQTLEPIGINANVKAAVQGKLFWQRQASLLRQDILDLTRRPTIRAEIDSLSLRASLSTQEALKRKESELKRMWTHLYDTAPELVPSAEQIVQDLVQARIDRLETKRVELTILEQEATRIAALQEILRKVQRQKLD